MTVGGADADQADEQRRPDLEGAREADGDSVMAHACHSEEQSDEESGVAMGSHLPGDGPGTASQPRRQIPRYARNDRLRRPMQTKRMSNGGPTLRGRARLTGA
jgi:hypothetical protein